tara:strand:+ start:126 stop:251 length:126 start_codon:yes stop_codon:yes gene_type:complete
MEMDITIILEMINSLRMERNGKTEIWIVGVITLMEMMQTNV